jgi:hypothetical protein
VGNFTCIKKKIFRSFTSLLPVIVNAAAALWYTQTLSVLMMVTSIVTAAIALFKKFVRSFTSLSVFVDAATALSYTETFLASKKFVRSFTSLLPLSVDAATAICILKLCQCFNDGY